MRRGCRRRMSRQEMVRVWINWWARGRISLECRCRIGGMRLALTLGKDVVGIQGGARRGACDDKLRKTGEGLKC
jgi:hypothetical protein